jgi:hypothetical protein
MKASWMPPPKLNWMALLVGKAVGELDLVSPAM